MKFVDSELPFDRVLAYADISQFILKFDDGTYKTYYPSWIGEDEYNNEAQSSIISEVNGSLFIVINEKDKVTDIFSDKIFSDDDFHWKMYRN